MKNLHNPLHQFARSCLLKAGNGEIYIPPLFPTRGVDLQKVCGAQPKSFVRKPFTKLVLLRSFEETYINKHVDQCVMYALVCKIIDPNSQRRRRR